MVKRILRYAYGTVDLGIHFSSNTILDLYTFSNADWADCPLTRRSIKGYCVFLGSNCIFWSTKNQATISRSSFEVEYRAMAQATAEITWICFLPPDLKVQLSIAPILLCDNLSALYMMVFHARSKHIEIDYHYLRERVALGLLQTRHVPASLQLANLLTKPLGRLKLYSLRSKFGLVP